MYNSNDTISAISTAQGAGGIGIVRVSGKRATAIVDTIFHAKDKTNLASLATHSMRYGWIKDPSGVVIDEVMVSLMRSPRSYTKEDVVEINCHGGIMPLKKILELVIAAGARLAEPGEFTRRAFLNGRIDLSQAEAVFDIITAKTDAALALSTQQLKGSVSRAIKSLHTRLVGALAPLEASIDFPDEELEKPERQKITEVISRVESDLASLLEASSRGRIMREGIHAVICGKANVGKSSLLNALLKQERSIVTPIAGTTRDAIEEILDIRGIPVRIVDTAGIIEPRDLIEKKAVARSRAHIAQADLILLVFDASKRIDTQDHLLIKKVKNRPVIAILNKIDLAQKMNTKALAGLFAQVVSISAKKSKNLAALEDAIVSAVYEGRAKVADSVIVSNMRHITLLKKAHELLMDARKALEGGLSLEFPSQNIKDALGLFDDIIGKRFSEQLLDKIFNEFCIGK